MIPPSARASSSRQHTESAALAGPPDPSVPPGKPAPAGPLAIPSGLALFLLAVLAWTAFVYAETYPRIHLAWKHPVVPRLPWEVRWNPDWLAIPLCAGFFVAAHALGRAMLRAFRPRGVDDGEAFALSLPVGLLPMSLGLFTLASLQLLSRPWMLALCGAALVIGRRELAALPRALRSAVRGRWSALGVTAAALLALQWGSAALVTLSPDLFFDAPHFHLYPTTTYLRAGGFTTVPGFVPLHVPELSHLLFAFMYDLAGNAGTRALSLLAGLYVVGFVGWAAGRIAGRHAGWIAALALGSTPVFVSFATVTQPDLVLTLLGVAGFWIAIRHGASPHGALLAGLLAGGTTATKIVGGLVGASIVVLCAVRAWRSSGARAGIRAGAIAAAGATVVALPWFLKTWIAIGNPAFPALASVFGHHVLDGEELRMLTASYFSRFGMGRDASAMLMLPWNFTVHGGAFSGCLGAFYLSAVPLLVLTRRDARIRPLLVAAALSFVAMALTQHVQRYFFPGLAMLIIALAATLERLPEAGGLGRTARRAAFALVLATAVLHLPLFQRGWLRAWFPYEMEEIPLANAAGAESDAAFLARRWNPCYPLAERHAGGWGEMKIIESPAFTELPAGWFEGHLFNNIVGNRTLERVKAARDGGPDAIAAVLRADGYTHVLVNGTPGPGDVFSEESAFAQQHLERVEAAGTCTLYALTSNRNGEITVADLAGRVRALPGGPPRGISIMPIVRRGVDGREALVVIAPHRASVPVSIPRQGAVFESALAMRWPGGDGAVAVLSWEGEGERVELLRVSVAPAPPPGKDDPGWLPVRLDLTPFAGRSGSLVLGSEPGQAGDDTSDWVGWAWPRVIATSRAAEAQQSRAIELQSRH